MTSSLNFSTATADLLAGELDTISFAQLTPGESLKLTTTVYDGDTSTVLDTWTTTFVADADGCIAIHHLASLWRNYIISRRRRDDALATEPPSLPGGIKVGFTYLLEDTTTATCARRIWYTRDDILTATVALMNDTVPFIARKKRTFTGAKERIYVIGPSARTIKVETIYLRNGAIGTSTHTLSTNVSSDSFARSTDVSPSRIQSLLTSGASLREYTVQIYSGTNLLIVASSRGFTGETYTGTVDITVGGTAEVDGRPGARHRRLARRVALRPCPQPMAAHHRHRHRHPTHHTHQRGPRLHHLLPNSQAILNADNKIARRPHRRPGHRLHPRP